MYIHAEDPAVGWSDFEEENMLHFLCCAQLLQDPNSKMSCLSVAFSLVAEPQKILTVNPKMSTKKHCLTFLKVTTETKFVL